LKLLPVSSRVTDGGRDPGEPAHTVLSWSGGKDASVALATLRDRDDTRLVELLTTVRADNQRVSMHGVRRALVQRQADAVSLPLRVVELPADASNDQYETVMADVHADYEARGVQSVAFADLHLDSVREYREQQLASTALDGRWPIWGRDTSEVAHEFLDAGFRATVVCVDGTVLDSAFVGREYDHAFLADLPDSADPCGENGEFHTFVHDGPVFADAIPIEVGERVTRDVKGSEFHYVDLLPA
jgi:uncharacterized protein (TIGR00290 family)